MELWIGFAITITVNAFVVGKVYGKLLGRLQLIEYRLTLVEGMVGKLEVLLPSQRL